MAPPLKVLSCNWLRDVLMVDVLIGLAIDHAELPTENCRLQTGLKLEAGSW
ncbi:MAG: hypothetical protein IPL92_19745 [Saprospiraceae bacterium]|nr:hypothetical protein [Candidatus Opimibacter iunctus]